MEPPKNPAFRNRDWTKKQVSDWLGRGYRPDKPPSEKDIQSRLTLFAEEDLWIGNLYRYEPT